jgi:hypothetical protein
MVVLGWGGDSEGGAYATWGLGGWTTGWHCLVHLVESGSGGGTSTGVPGTLLRLAGA